MNSEWQTVGLGELLTRSDRWTILDSETEYKEVTVRLWGRGVALRGLVSGAAVAGARRVQVKSGEFIASRIDARNGAFGLIPDELDGAVVTNDFPVFGVDAQRLLPGYLHWLSKTRDFVEACKAASEGTTNRVRLKEDRFLQIEIPLPPLAEQRQIVAKIERVAGKVEGVYETRSDVATLTERLVLEVLRQMIHHAPTVRLSDIAPVVRRPIEIDETAAYPEVGIRSFGKGTFHKPALAALDVGTKRLFQIHAGDLLFSNVFAWEGAIAVAQPQDHGRYGSHRFITCVPKPNGATAEYLCSYFLTPEGRRQIGEASPGGAGRNRTLGVAKLEGIPVPVPAYKEQVKFTRLLAKINATRFQQSQTAAELDALLPAVLDRAFRGEL